MRHFALIFTFAVLPLLGGCLAVGTQQPKITQLQIRQMQTREYQVSRKIVMEATLSFLQDEGYIIKNADSELGIIHATRDVDIENRWTRFFAGAFEGKDARWEKNSIYELSVNVREFGKSSKVRLILQVKNYDNIGAVSQVWQVKDGEFYRDAFSKIDKAVFLQKENL